MFNFYDAVRSGYSTMCHQLNIEYCSRQNEMRAKIEELSMEYKLVLEESEIEMNDGDFDPYLKSAKKELDRLTKTRLPIILDSYLHVTCDMECPDLCPKAKHGYCLRKQKVCVGGIVAMIHNDLLSPKDDLSNYVAQFVAVRFGKVRRDTKNTTYQVKWVKKDMYVVIHTPGVADESLRLFDKTPIDLTRPTAHLPRKKRRR